MKNTLIYFAQRGQWAGYWRKVPLQNRIKKLSLDTLHEGLRKRGHILEWLTSFEKGAE
jgi:hypothetical protein